MSTDLSHHRTCRSAYGGSYFGCHSRYEPIKVTISCLAQDIVIHRPFQNGAISNTPIPFASITPFVCLIFIYTTSDEFATFVLHFFQAFHIHMRILRLLLTSHGKLYSIHFVKKTILYVRETSSDRGINFPSYVYFIYIDRSE